MVQPIHLRIFGIIIILLIVAIVTLSLREKKPANKSASTGKRSAMPMITLELPNSVDDVRQTAGDLGDERRTYLLNALKLDSLLFIPSYTLLFVAMGWLLTQRRFSLALWLGIAAGICGVGAAIFDYMENAHIRALLTSPLAQTTQQMIDSTRHISLIKWMLSFIAIGLLSSLFFWRKDWILILGILYLITSLVGLAGSFYRPAIGWAFGLMGAGILFVSLVFTIFAEEFLQPF